VWSGLLAPTMARLLDIIKANGKEREEKTNQRDRE
jgi:hypothetical protein